MRIRRLPLPPPALVLGLLALPAFSQDWDAVKSASGWASFDRDGSCVFLDSGNRRLVVWTRDGGVTDEVDLSKLPAPAEKWVLDPSGNAWVVHGTTLQLVAKTGKLITSHSLPAEVADLAWDARGFVLAYRTEAPLVERRDMKTGSVLWAWGSKPPKGAGPVPVRHHVAIREDGTVLLNSGDSFQLTTLDGTKGAQTATLAFALEGKPAPTLNLGQGDRGALAWWLNRNTALLAVPAAQLPAALNLQGLVLARLDLDRQALTFLPTGLDEKAALVGILEDAAVLRKTEGGLAFVPIPQ